LDYNCPGITVREKIDDWIKLNNDFLTVDIETEHLTFGYRSETITMEMELALPQSIFRTYMDIDMREFMTQYHVEAPMETFSPPEEWNLSPNAFRSMITLDSFYDTEVAARPRSYVMVPSELDTDDPRLLGLSMFDYSSDVLYKCHPARTIIPMQIHAMNVRGSDSCLILMPSPNCSAQIPLMTLFHEVEVDLRYPRHIDTQDHRETTSWFDGLPRAVQLYLAPLQNQWLTEWLPALNGYPAWYGICHLCNTKDHNLRRHHMRHHAPMRAIYFCPIEGCPSVLIDQQGLRDHLKQNTHRGGAVTRDVISSFAAQNCFWPISRAWAAVVLGSSQKFHAYIMLHALAGVALQRTFYAARQSVIHTNLMEAINYLRPRFDDPSYNFRIIKEELYDSDDDEMPMVPFVPTVPVVTPVSPISTLPVPSRGRGRGRGFLHLIQENQQKFSDAVQAMTRSRGPLSAPESDTECRMTTPDHDRSSSEDDFDDAERCIVVDGMPSMPNLELVNSRAVSDVALAAIEESLEGAVGSSAVISLPGGVESPCRDTTCPGRAGGAFFHPGGPGGLSITSGYFGGIPWCLGSVIPHGAEDRGS